jgi:hypothetical protein
MKKPNPKTAQALVARTSISRAATIAVRIPVILLAAVLLGGFGASVAFANGTAQYFDVNNSTAGFGTPASTGVYDMIGATNATTTLTTGFSSGVSVSQVTVTSTTSIAAGQIINGTGIPTNTVMVSAVNTGTKVVTFVSSFTSTATSGAGNYLFGSPITWTTSSAGTTAPTAWVTGDQMTFGAVAGDTSLQGTFSVNLDSGNHLGGILVNSTGLNITLNGSANTFPSGAQTWTVNSGSTLTESDTRHNGLNFNNDAVTFAGAGTLSFGTVMGAGSSAALTDNMTGTLNLQQTADVSGQVGFTGSFTLNSGTRTL